MNMLALGLMIACAGRRGPVDPPPAWRSDEGRLAARLDVADALVDSGSPDAALTVVTQLRSEGVKTTQLDLIQARALAGIGLTDDAEALLLEIIGRHPREARAHDQLGVLHLDRGRVDEAVVELQRAARLAPDDADIMNNLGFALMTAGQATEAVAVLREALRIEGADRQIRNNLGFALVASKRDDEALRVFRAGLPEPDARYNFGLGLELRGDVAAAVDQYLLVVDRWPEHQKAVEGLRRLRPDDLHRLALPTNSSPMEAP